MRVVFHNRRLFVSFNLFRLILISSEPTLRKNIYFFDIAQATSQPKFEILPISEKEFIVRELNAKLLFVKEPDGKVSKLILDMAGQKKDVIRIAE